MTAAAKSAGAKPAPEVKLCSQCRKNPRAYPDSTNAWCLECNARYQRERIVLAKNRTYAEGFVDGRERMREMIVEEFAKLGSGGFTALEVAQLVAQMPGPQAQIPQE